MNPGSFPSSPPHPPRSRTATESLFLKPLTREPGSPRVGAPEGRPATTHPPPLHDLQPPASLAGRGSVGSATLCHSRRERRCG